ncbi:unnamed protein product [Nippostrongylus brasiliensis]|uniref:C2H2-type domain-containing protein n=1 Tax=Nippostrongylus brasiliensis TaxID=27835 RepID=A0A0N4Y4W9_NIPBR|nr:unnamed protein product [Nippostrongylus brasiliensis]
MACTFYREPPNFELRFICNFKGCLDDRPKSVMGAIEHQAFHFSEVYKTQAHFNFKCEYCNVYHVNKSHHRLCLDDPIGIGHLPTVVMIMQVPIRTQDHLEGPIEIKPVVGSREVEGDPGGGEIVEAVAVDEDVEVDTETAAMATTPEVTTASEAEEEDGKDLAGAMRMVVAIDSAVGISNRTTREVAHTQGQEVTALFRKRRNKQVEVERDVPILAHGAAVLSHQLLIKRIHTTNPRESDHIRALEAKVQCAKHQPFAAVIVFKRSEGQGVILEAEAAAEVRLGMISTTIEEPPRTVRLWGLNNSGALPHLTLVAMQVRMLLQ